MHRYLFIAALAAVGGYLYGLSDGIAIFQAAAFENQVLGGLPLVGN